ncbi:MAG: hypothetical protein ACXWTT_12845 [Methylobacter sp.]
MPNIGWQLCLRTTPAGLNGCHFSKDLISFIRYQYAHPLVTRLLRWKQLQDLGSLLTFFFHHEEHEGHESNYFSS